MNPSWNFRFTAPTSDILMRLVVSVYMWDSHDWWYILPGSRIPNQAFYIPEHQAFGMKHLIASRHPHQASSLLHQASTSRSIQHVRIKHGTFRSLQPFASNILHAEAWSILHQAFFFKKHSAFRSSIPHPEATCRGIQHSESSILLWEASRIVHEASYIQKHSAFCMKHSTCRSI